MTDYVNPKDIAAQGADKAPLDYLEPAADEATARALAFGGAKYGPRNFTKSPIAARVYVAAIRRHLTAWLQGEDFAQDSGVHHLGHVAANCHVALAAIEAGTFIDDRHHVEEEGQPVDHGPEDAIVPRACPNPGLSNGGICDHACPGYSYDVCLSDCERVADMHSVSQPEFVETVEERKARLARERYAPVVTIRVNGVELGHWADKEACWDAPSEFEAAARLAEKTKPYAWGSGAGSADRFAAEVHGHIARAVPVATTSPIPSDRIGTCEGVIGGWHE